MRDRLFRLIGKKKGNRRSGSPWWGIFIDVFFSTALVIVGLILIVATITAQIQYFGENQSIAWVSLITQLLIGILLFGIGLYNVLRTLWFTRTSAERRSAIVSLARDVELFNELGSEAETLPTVPGSLYVHHHSGQRLNHRLLRHGMGQLSIWVSAGMTLLFIVVSTVLVMFSIQAITGGDPRWILMVLTLIHLAATIFQIYYFLRQLVRSSALGPTRLEISEASLTPGANIEMFFSQSGRLFMKLVDIELVCFEQSTFNQGTDIRTETKPVFRQRVFRRRGVSINASEPLESQFDFEVPRGAMHSFHSENNQINWKFVVTCVARGWPKFERLFPVVLRPASQS